MIKVNIEPEGLINKIYQPFLLNEHKTQIFFGGSSSGKSVFLAQRILLDIIRGRNYLVVRKVGNTISKSCWNEITKAISQMKLSMFFKFGKSDLVITCAINGCQILFAGLDDVEKIKSITPQRGSLTDIWCEEATEIDYTDYKQLLKRMRGESKFKKRFTLSFNPIYQTHWIYAEFFVNWVEGKNIYQDDNLLIVKSTHEDNEFLTDDDHEALRNEKDEYYYNVYTLGNWGVLGDIIFKNWRVEDLSELIDVGNQKIELWKTFDNIRNGLDFGFASDPSAFIRVHYDRMRKKIYILKEFYQRGYTNSMLASELKPIISNERIICDSAEPKSIQELRNAGINALSALKGKDSVNFGIQWLQDHEIIIDMRCQNIKNELVLYQWKKDKDGNTIKQPVDKFNHLIDSLRYALSLDMEEFKAGKATISSIAI